jgi:hypothetical protein
MLPHDSTKWHLMISHGAGLLSSFLSMTVSKVHLLILK